MNMSQLKERVIAALPTVLVGLFAGIAGVAGSYAVAGFTPGFVGAPIAGFLSRTLPGFVIRFAITTLGSLGQKVNLISAIGLAIVGYGTLAGAGIVLGKSLNNRAVAPFLTGVGAWALTSVVTGTVVLAFGAAVPAAFVVLLAVVLPALDVGPVETVSGGRRQIVGTGLSVLGIGTVGYVLGRERTPSSTGSLDDDGGGDAQSLESTDPDTGSTGGSDTGGGDTGDDGEETTEQEQDQPSRRQQLLNDAEEKQFDVSGMEPLVSENFYQVDINAVDPTVDESSWTLSVTGAVENEVEIDYQELRSMESIDRFETLRCVGEGLNGNKLDNALWTGVPIMDIVERANPRSGCECVMLRAEDDYFEEFPIAAMEDGMLAYGMNGDVLPRAHGYPVRAMIPGHWGEINLKWVSEIEILDEEADGYWEQRGWHGTGPVNTVAKLYAVNDLDDGRKELGGHAYAGTRGIQTVEVSTDGGQTWNGAELTEPLEGIDVWRQWRYRYDPPGGEHEVVVRATDGEGTLQTEEEASAFPSGPTGWVSETVQ